MLYFDNSATTKPCEEALSAAHYAIEACWGNPSSLHFAGDEASALLKKSRKQVSALLKCRPESFFFTPSGTCANNTAIFGAYEKRKKLGNRIVTTDFEHPSVSEPVKQLEKLGAEVVRIKPSRDGKISEDELLSAINENTVLVTCMAVNNEVGSVTPLTGVSAAIKRAGAPAVFHTDCVQALGKTEVSPKALGADIITVSAHKIHGLKGAGGIYLKEKNTIKPYILGGGQESGIFSGTEAMPAIAAFGAAAEAVGNIEENGKRLAKLKTDFVNAVRNNPHIVINSPDDAIPYIINLSIKGMPSQPTVNYMSEKGICISAGSACKTGHRSAVLTSMGLPTEITDSAVRISLSRFTTEEELSLLLKAIIECADKYGR